MSLPSHITTANLSGKFTMNKVLSNSGQVDQMLSLQGIGWIKRKAISIGTITLTFNHFTDAHGTDHFNIDNYMTGGIPGSREERPVDGTERPRSDMHFGAQMFYTKRLPPGETKGLSEFLKGGWTEDTLDKGLLVSRIWSDSRKSGTSWVEVHTWGIQVVEGERRFVRRIEFEGPKKQRLDIVMYFDYVGA